MSYHSQLLQLEQLLSSRVLDALELCLHLLHALLCACQPIAQVSRQLVRFVSVVLQPLLVLQWHTKCSHTQEVLTMSPHASQTLLLPV